MARYRKTGSSSELDAAIAAAEGAAAAGYVRVEVLVQLAGALQIRWRRSGEATNLAAAVDLRIQAMAAGPLPSQIPHLCTCLASVLRDRFERYGDMTDLRTALTAARTAVRAAQADSRGRCLANLSGVHRTRFERTRRPKDLLRAVRSAREAVAVTAADDPEFPRRLSTLTLALLRDFGYHRDRRRVDCSGMCHVRRLCCRGRNCGSQ